MTFIRDTFNFLKRERIWTLLFIFLVSAYVYVANRPEKKIPKLPSPALEKLQEAETRLKNEIKVEGGVGNYLAGRPKLLIVFSLFTAFLMVTFFLGVVVDVLWFARPSWRNRLQPATGPPEARSWSIGTVFKAIILFVLATLALTVVMAILKRILFHAVSPNFIILIHTTLTDLICIGFVIWFIERQGGNWKDLGFRGIQWLKDIWTGLVGYAAILPLFFTVLFALIAIVQFFNYEPPPHPLVQVFLEEERSPWLIGYSLFLACVAGPILEEIFFRGFCYPAFKKRWGAGKALILTASFFSLIHQNAFAFLPVFILGLGLGYLYEKRGTLVPSIMLHVVHNTVFIGYFFLAKEVLTAK